MNLENTDAVPGEGNEGIMFEIPIELPDPTVLNDEEKTALTTALQKSAETLGVQQMSDVLLMASRAPNEAIQELRRLAQAKVEDAQAVTRYESGLETLGEIEAGTHTLSTLDDLHFKIVRLRDSVDLNAPPTEPVIAYARLLMTNDEIECYSTSMEAFEGMGEKIKVLAKATGENIVKYTGNLYDVLLDALGANDTRLKRLQEQIRKADFGGDDERRIELTQRQLANLTTDGDPQGIDGDLSTLLQTLQNTVVRHQADVKRYDGIAYNFLRTVTGANNEEAFHRALTAITRVQYPHPGGFSTKKEEDRLFYTSPLLPGGRQIVMEVKDWIDHPPETISNAVSYLNTVQKSVDYALAKREVNATASERGFTKNDLLGLCDTALSLNGCYRDLTSGLQQFGNVMKRWQSLTESGTKNLQKQDWLSETEFTQVDKLFDIYAPEVAFYTRLVPRVTVYVDKVITEVIALCSKAV